jgi:hypothetical protein
VTDYQIEALADEVVSAFGLTTLPVDLLKIAGEENIELIEGDFGEDFHGRIEYLSEVKTFVIYHPSLAGNQYIPRVRFSIAHELGHYYIPVHRKLLLKGASHYSLEEFGHKNPIERQADTFAAALLIPTSALKARLGRRGFLSLSQILSLAQDCVASAQATAFRYTRFTKEPHLAVVSENAKVLYAFASEEARTFGLGSLRDQIVPDNSPTLRTMPGGAIQEGKTQGELWFPDRDYNAELWEEAIRLGSSNRVLTLLSWPNYER